MGAGAVMTQIELDRMSADDLWALHVEVRELLHEKLQAEKLALEKRLKLLEAPVSTRRPYPPVSPKYCNPTHLWETWSGRGKQPRWLVAQLNAGGRIDDFRIKRVANKR